MGSAIELDDMDKSILNEIQSQFPLTHQPYEKIGQAVGISESDTMSRLKRLKEA